MLKFLWFVCILVITALPARADPVSLSVSQVIDLLATLKSLDGYDQVSKGQDGADKIVHIPYKFSGNTRLTFGRDMIQMRGVAQAFQGAQENLRDQFISENKLKISADGKKLEGPGLDEYTQQVQEMLNQKQSLELYRVKVDDLKLDENPIPPSTIALMQPILDDK